MLRFYCFDKKINKRSEEKAKNISYQSLGEGCRQEKQTKQYSEGNRFFWGTIIKRLPRPGTDQDNSENERIGTDFRK